MPQPTPRKIAIIGRPSQMVASTLREIKQYGEEPLLLNSANEQLETCFIAFVCADFIDNESLEQVHRIKRANRTIPVVLVGKVTSHHDIVEGFRLGANDFLFPPIQNETLFHCIHRFKISKPVQRAKTWWEKLLPSFLFRKKELSFGIVPPILSNPYQSIKEENGVPNLQVQMLSSFFVSINGKSLDHLSGRKTKSVLAYIFYKHPKPVHKEVLIDIFWKDSIPDAARNCLNSTIHNIRKQFELVAAGEEVIVFKDECYCIGSELRVEKDIDLFKSYWNKARQIEINQGMKAAVTTYHQAFAFYRGDFLEKMTSEEWPERDRDWFRETWIVILERLTTYFFENEKYQICLNLCQKILEKDACLEVVHRRIMSCHLKMKMKDMAIRQFNKCRAALKEGLDISPGKETLELYNKIRLH